MQMHQRLELPLDSEFKAFGPALDLVCGMPQGEASETVLQSNQFHLTVFWLVLPLARLPNAYLTFACIASR